MSSAQRPRAAGYSCRDGHPLLCTDLSFAASLSRALHAERDGSSSSVRVWVEWGGSGVHGIALEDGELFVLCARHGSRELTRTSSEGSHRALSLQLTDDSLPLLAAGECLVIELRWSRGSRHLHLILPLQPSNLVFSNLIAAPSRQQKARADDTTAASLCSPSAGALGMAVSSVERGFGVELELMTESGPGRPNALTRPNPGAGLVLDQLVERFEAAAADEETRVALCRLRLLLLACN